MIKSKNIHSKGRKRHQTNNFWYKPNNNDNVNKRHDKTTATDKKEEAKIRWRRKVGAVYSRNKLHRHIIPVIIDDDDNHTKTTWLTKQQLTSEN